MLWGNPLSLGSERETSWSAEVCLLSSWSSQRHWVRCVLQPLPERGPRHTVCHLQRLHIPVCHLPRGGTRIIQFLPDLRAWWAHQPHDGVVSDPGGVSHRVWMSLPAWKHILNLWTREVVANPRGLHECWMTSSSPEGRLQQAIPDQTGAHTPQRLPPHHHCNRKVHELLLLFRLAVGGIEVTGKEGTDVQSHGARWKSSWRKAPASRAVFTFNVWTLNHWTASFLKSFQTKVGYKEWSPEPKDSVH